MNERTKLHIKTAKSFLNNKLIVKKNFESIDVSKGIKWDYKHPTHTKTYQVYLHSLEIIKSLVITYSTLNEELYLKAARNLIDSWINRDLKVQNTQIWHEHAVSSRIQNIIYFQNRAKDLKLTDELFQELLLEHCEFLSKKENYMENNHGIMMDRSLIVCSKYLIDKKLKSLYLEIAYYRIKMAFFRDFSKMGVHLENSPEYHKMVLNLLVSAEKSLNGAGMSIGKEYKPFVSKANRYFSYMLKPNLEMPLIGDSGLYLETNKSKLYGDFVDYEAGQAISQYKNVGEPEASSWLFFKSGYRSLTHKHRDDLSVNLYINGHDILVDSGKYSYNLKDPKRAFIVSPKAHSTVYFKDSDYKLTNPYDDQSSLKLSRFVNRHNYKVSTGYNNLYDEGNITRHVILTKERTLIIYDRINCKTIQRVVQNYNLSENANSVKVSEYCYEIVIDDKVYFLETFLLDDEHVSSQKTDSIISHKFGKYVDTSRIEFEKDCKNSSFITILYEKNENKRITDLKFNRQRISYTYENVIKEFLI